MKTRTILLVFLSCIISLLEARTGPNLGNKTDHQKLIKELEKEINLNSINFNDSITDPVNVGSIGQPLGPLQGAIDTALQTI